MSLPSGHPSPGLSMGPAGWPSGREWGGHWEGHLGPPELHSHRTQGLALTHVLRQSLRPAAGPRPEAAKVVILVTDGKSQDDAHAAGRVLKDLDVDVFAVGEQPQTTAGGLPARGAVCTRLCPRLEVSR